MEEFYHYKQVEVSAQFYQSNIQVYLQSIDLFGYSQAELYNQQINEALRSLHYFYLAYPECRHLSTRSRMYRNIILDAHLIVYRVTAKRVEMLDIVHAASSIRRICDTRRIRL